MQFDTQFKHSFKANIQQMELGCHPAIVVGVDRLKEGLIDVQPLTNKPVGNDYIEYPTINDVQIVTYSTMTSRIVLPVEIGDTVLLLFTKHCLDSFKQGIIETHDPQNHSLYNLGNAVAILGFNDVLSSVYDNRNYTQSVDFENLNIVHNADTGSEIVLSLQKDGTIRTNAPIYTEKDIFIQNLSVLQHMQQHQHPYTDDGNPMTTSPPIPLPPSGV